MTDFRIMPAQGRIEKSGTRYGFIIPNHPFGIETPAPNLDLKAGDYVASWETFAIAEMAAYALGMSTHKIVAMSAFVPDAEFSA